MSAQPCRDLLLVQERGACEQGPWLTFAEAFPAGFGKRTAFLPEQRKGKNEEATEDRLLSSRLFWRKGLTTFYMLPPKVLRGRKAGVKQVPKAAGGLWPCLG